MNVPLKLPSASVEAIAVTIPLLLQPTTRVRSSTVDSAGGGRRESTFPEKLTLVWPGVRGDGMAFNVVVVWNCVV